MVLEVNRSRGDVRRLKSKVIDVEVGRFYQISHDNLPPRTPSWLKSIQVVLVSENTKLKVAVKFPSLESLKKYVSIGTTGFLPSLDMSFIMGTELSQRVLLWQVAKPDFDKLEDFLGFWLLDSSLIAPKLKVEEVSPMYLSSSTIDYEEEKLDEVDNNELQLVVVKEENIDGGFGAEDVRRKRFKWWSEESFEAGKGIFLSILKEKNATADNPISRADLRKVAQKQIGNTGLLDHILSHTPGMIAPDGISRFQRCYNAVGVIMYWLESAQLVDIKRKAGVTDPSWIPPPGWKLGSCSARCACSKELEILKEELAKVKSELEETKKQLNEVQAVDISGRYPEFSDCRDWVGGFW